ncbi:MAG TPA: LuxR C-terminal-related transcriptional regulator [Gemmatimonadaceae bacterium]|nr:LuxR C-terminal-related transcriptional regulator [Gemmatimonadaceae bacterium]
MQLTEREHKVLALMTRGLRNRQITAALRRGEATVKVHVLHILSKLGSTIGPVP